jgi:hypothetical protein
MKVSDFEVNWMQLIGELTKGISYYVHTKSIGLVFGSFDSLGGPFGMPL